MEHNGIEYCFQCNESPCEKYEKIDKFDSFISHRNQKSDLEKARQIGIEAYNAEQEEKVEILGTLLAGYNDGRKKTLFCVAVNLLKIHELRAVLGKIENRSDLENLTLKEKALLLLGC